MRTSLLDPAIAMAVAGVAALVVLALAVSTGVAQPIDTAITGVVRSDALVEPLAPLRPVTELGSTWAVTGVAIVVLLVEVAARRPALGAAAAATIALAAFATAWLKQYVARERPDLLEPLVVEPGFSFPSGHAATSAVAYGMVAVLVLRSTSSPLVRAALVVPLVTIVALVGVSRVYLGAHHPSDVVAGWVAGTAVVVLVARLTRGLDRRASQPRGAEGASRGTG